MSSCLEKKKKGKISVTNRMRRQLTGNIPDMIIYYDRYELGVAEAGKGRDRFYKNTNAF